MKPILTHLFAAALGAAVVILWPNREVRRGDETGGGDGSTQVHHHGSGYSPSSPSSSRAKRSDQPLSDQLHAPVDRVGLDSWILSKKNDPRAYAEALVIAGVISKDPDLVRQGIRLDPDNSHLLFIGASLGAFTDEERREMTGRLLVADPQNALGAYFRAQQLLAAGDTGAAIEMLKGSKDRQQVNDYRTETQMLVEDALIASGMSPEVAKVRSLSEQELGYLGDMKAMVKALKEAESSLSESEANELRVMAATMGQRLGERTKSGALLDRLFGMSLEESTLKGMPDEALSPYEGLTVGQARESIQAEREELKGWMNRVGDWEQLLMDEPQLMVRYADRCRVMGELEAVKWLVGEMEGSRGHPSP